MDLVKVIAAEHVRDFIIKIKFNDGLVAEIDFENELWGEIFTPLKEDSKFFTQFSLNPWTLEWPNGADFAPEFLHELALRNAVQNTPM